jgi:peptidoglycan/xylan/chitin deacetylase (PgdA/CDA1 family)
MNAFSKAALDVLSRSAAFAALVAVADRTARLEPAGWLRVLAYHRIDDPRRRPDLYPGLVSATPTEFEMQMRLLARRFRVVSLPEVLQALRRGTTIPPRAVLITFDDAYADFARYAWPILKQHGMPATLFVPTAFPGGNAAFWWDRLYGALPRATDRDCETPLGRLPCAKPAQRLVAFRRLRDYAKSLSHHDAMAVVERVIASLAGGTRSGETNACRAPAVLNWSELRALAQDGVTLAPHTRTHPLLTRVSAAEARAEVVGSFWDLRREVGQVAAVFAYPNGACDSGLARMLAGEGFELAFALGGGHDLRTDDRWRVQRIPVGPRTNTALMLARLLWVSRSRRRGRCP